MPKCFVLPFPSPIPLHYTALLSLTSLITVLFSVDLYGIHRGGEGRRYSDSRWTYRTHGTVNIWSIIVLYCIVLWCVGIWCILLWSAVLHLSVLYSTTLSSVDYPDSSLITSPHTRLCHLHFPHSFLSKTSLYFANINFPSLHSVFRTQWTRRKLKCLCIIIFSIAELWILRKTSRY